jgi:hypothetical protein
MMRSASSRTPRFRRGVRAPGLAEAAHEHVVARLEVDHLELHAGPAQLVEHSRDVLQKAPLAHVDAERDATDVLPRALPQLEEARQECRGQVVDAVEAQVLQDLQRRALAGPGQAGHHDGMEALAHRIRDRCAAAAARSMRALNSAALWRPRQRSSWFRAAVSMSSPTVLPAVTGIRTSGSETSSSV